MRFEHMVSCKHLIGIVIGISVTGAANFFDANAQGKAFSTLCELFLNLFCRIFS